MDIHALRKRGWSISAIARHVGRDRKTVRAYLEGKRQVGQRAPAGEDVFARFVDYAAARLVEDPHLWATALHDEVVKLGYDRSYPSFTRALRMRRLRPACEPCHPVNGRPSAVIEHPPGEETQWDSGGAARPARRLGRLRQEGVSVGRGAGAFVEVAWGAV